jgi:pyruvate dehydrogenase E2 component (dihydrolipoamide acetyltransferase)
MAVEITMPKMGLTMVTGKVGRWLKNEGDSITKGDAVLEIMTEKITNILEAPATGTLLKIAAAEGTEFPVGGVLGYIGAAGEIIAGKEPMERIKITPAARKLAEEMKVDLSKLVGTGPSGRITREDIEKTLAEASVFAGPFMPAAEERSVPDANGAAFTGAPYIGIRRVIGDHMAKSWGIAPKVNYHVSVDISALNAMRKSINANREEKISLTDILVKAVAKALRMRPQINVSLVGDEIRTYQEINIGVATSLENGLVVPVVKNADLKTLSQVSREAKDLAKRAKAGQLSLTEIQGGTFTITNIGAYNSVDWFTPIINQPESAILGIGRTVETPVALDGQIVIRPMLGISLSFDHRVIDGAPAAEFLAVLLRLIEQPFAILD